MVCTNCGRRATSETYSLRFNPERQAPRELELELCESCLEMMTGEPAIHLVSPEPPMRQR